MTSPSVGDSNQQRVDGNGAPDGQGAPAPEAVSVTRKSQPPFVFRTGGLDGRGARVRTIRDAIRHMDRHPDDGIFHLRNGSLARWLAERGEDQLARRATEMSARTEPDIRAALERFLIATGLVARPRLAAQPGVIDLGYAISGETVQRRLVVRKGRGRGYLYGNLRPSHSWMRVAPDLIVDGVADTVVTVDTNTLPIARAPSRGAVYANTSASQEPIGIPVIVRVRGQPSRWDRFLLRPLFGLASAGLVGAGIGYALDRLGGLPLAGIIALPGLTWAALLAAFWAVMGALRGLRQPPAWPTVYAGGRWLARTVAWAFGLGAVALLATWTWEGAAVAGQLPGSVWLTCGLAGAALAIVPVVVSESRRRTAPVTRTFSPARPRRKWLVGGIAVAALAALLVAGRFARPAWEQSVLPGYVPTVSAWVQVQGERLNAVVGSAVNRAYLRFYDRRAPAATPTRQPTPGAPASQTH